MTKRIFAIALAALLLFTAGCQWLPCGGDVPLPTWTPGQTDPGTGPVQWGTTAAPATDEPPATTAVPVPTTVRSWNGIAEGDVIIGELTFYCSCEECNAEGLGFSSNGYNGPFSTAITADGKIVADLI